MLGVAAVLLVPIAIATPCLGSDFQGIQTRGPAKAQAGRQLLESALAPAVVDSADDANPPQPQPPQVAVNQDIRAEEPADTDAENPAEEQAPVSRAANRTADSTEEAEDEAAEQEPGAQPEEGMQFEWQDRGKNGFRYNYGKPRVIWRDGEVVYEKDGVTCKGLSRQTEAQTMFESAELHAAAVTEAISYMCDPGPSFNVSHLEEIFADAEAYAFAQAAVHAALSCVSTDAEAPNTCVSYTASATAMAEATAAGHSEAVALAVKNCSCMTEAVATSFASDTLFVDLVADATVTAEATVCVEGRNHTTSTVWEQCTSVLYAKLFAKAAAQAAAFGTCLSLDAMIELETYVDAEVTVENTPECDVEPGVKFTGARPLTDNSTGMATVRGNATGSVTAVAKSTAPVDANSTGIPPLAGM